jgi:hypothetical protein
MKFARVVLLVLPAAAGLLGGALPAAAQTGLSFNGSNQHVTFGAASALDASNFTVELWFMKTGAGVTTSTGTGGVNALPLLTKGRAEVDMADNRDMNYFLGIDATGHLVADYEEGTGRGPSLNHPVVGATVIADNVWHHGAAVYDGAALRVYLDGALDGVTSGLSGRAPQSASIQHAGLGTALNSTGVASGFFAGVTDEPRIWNVAHSQCQIVANMEAEVTSGAGLIGRWGLNEGRERGGELGGGLAERDAGERSRLGRGRSLQPDAAGGAGADGAERAGGGGAGRVGCSSPGPTTQLGRRIRDSARGTLVTTVGPNVTGYLDAPLLAQTSAATTCVR